MGTKQQVLTIGLKKYRVEQARLYIQPKHHCWSVEINTADRGDEDRGARLYLWGLSSAERLSDIRGAKIELADLDDKEWGLYVYEHTPITEGVVRVVRVGRKYVDVVIKARTNSVFVYDPPDDLWVKCSVTCTVVVDD